MIKYGLFETFCMQVRNSTLRNFLRNNLYNYTYTFIPVSRYLYQIRKFLSIKICIISGIFLLCTDLSFYNSIKVIYFIITAVFE